jgi:hypothetical protein
LKSVFVMSSVVITPKKRPAWVAAGWSPEAERHERVACLDAVLTIKAQQTRSRMQWIGLALMFVAVTVAVGCAMQ